MTEPQTWQEAIDAMTLKQRDDLLEACKPTGGRDWDRGELLFFQRGPRAFEPGWKSPTYAWKAQRGQVRAYIETKNAELEAEAARLVDHLRTREAFRWYYPFEYDALRAVEWMLR